MTPANIEEMVAVIAGSFPLDNVFKPDVCKAWQRHDLISNMSVEEGRAVQKRVVNFCDHFPSTHDIVKAYWMLFGKKPTECRTCDSTGWVVPRDEEGNRLTYPGRNYLGRPVHYTYVLQCWNCNGGTRPDN